MCAALLRCATAISSTASLGRIWQPHSGARSITAMLLDPRRSLAFSARAFSTQRDVYEEIAGTRRLSHSVVSAAPQTAVPSRGFAARPADSPAASTFGWWLGGARHGGARSAGPLGSIPPSRSYGKKLPEEAETEAEAEAAEAEEAEGKEAKDEGGAEGVPEAEQVEPVERHEGEPVGAGEGPSREVTENKSSHIVVSSSYGNNSGTKLLATARHVIPPAVPIIPLYQRPVFPGIITPLAVHDVQLTKEIIRRKEQGQDFVGLFLVRKKDEPQMPEAAAEESGGGNGKDNKKEKTGGAGAGKGEEEAGGAGRAGGGERRQWVRDPGEVAGVGTVARIDRIITSPAGTATLVLTALSRVAFAPPEPSPSPSSPSASAAQPSADSEGGGAGEAPAAQGGRRGTAGGGGLAPSLAGRAGRLRDFRVDPLRDFPYDRNDPLVRALTLEVVGTIKEIVQLSPFFKEQLQTFLELVDFSNTSELADMAACLTTSDGQVLQEVLEERDVVKRLQKSLGLLKKELELNLLQQKISKQIEDQMTQNQRRYFLTEQMKTIKKELGIETDEKEALVSKFRDRLSRLKLPEEAAKTVEEELNKLGTIEPSSSEFNVTRNYLDWLTQLPWGLSTQDNFDIGHAQTVLDEDHYGLKDIKERILEFIAVGQSRGTLQGKIILMVGPPGVGKTSIGKSIARSLSREFFRFSVGGLRDVAEIKGHRRTYVGAMPGKLIQALKRAQTCNPVILIDEVDKIGSSGIHGDPSSALLEVLDPEQNAQFLDHYLDLPFDLSQVLFICTANTTDTIPGPLLDRMEVLRLSGYVLQEKLQILKGYLLPQARADSGIGPRDCTLRESAGRELIGRYCREAGVRNLQKHVEKILRKVALRRARGQLAPVSVTASNLEEFVGKPLFSDDRMYGPVTPPGIVCGLAWTSMGGATLYIETTNTSGDGAPVLLTTGQMGEVMEESTKIALTYARQKLPLLAPGNRSLDTQGVHLHIPEGATPKDGPSAGVTMVTALLSLALSRPVRPRLAMTGEISLTGKVLAIGGVKEKVLAARRSGIRTLVFPKANRYDFEKLEDYVREGLQVFYAETYDDVYKVAFGSDEEVKKFHDEQTAEFRKLDAKKAAKKKKPTIMGMKKPVRKPTGDSPATSPSSSSSSAAAEGEKLDETSLVEDGEESGEESDAELDQPEIVKETPKSPPTPRKSSAPAAATSSKKSSAKSSEQDKDKAKKRSPSPPRAKSAEDKGKGKAKKSN